MKYIKKELNEHTCSYNNTLIRTDNIVDISTDLFINAPDIKTANVQNVSRTAGGLNINYHQGYKALQKLRRFIEENERKSIKKIKAWLEWQKDNNQGTHVNYSEKIDLTDNTRKFESCFFATTYTKEALAYTLPIITLDACHTKGIYKGIIYTATAITSNNNAFNLAIGLEPTESYFYWKRFLIDLKISIEIPENQPVVIISDREKGLALSLSEVFPRAHHSFCVFHTEKNIKVRFKKDTNKLLWKSAKALTIPKFERHTVLVENFNNLVLKLFKMLKFSTKLNIWKMRVYFIKLH